VWEKTGIEDTVPGFCGTAFRLWEKTGIEDTVPGFCGTAFRLWEKTELRILSLVFAALQ
jgi:hypothetical protein